MSPAPIHPTERFVVGASDTHTTTTTTITILGRVWAHIHNYTYTPTHTPLQNPAMWPNTFNKKCATISGWQGLGDFTAVREQLQKLRSSTTHRPPTGQQQQKTSGSSSGGGSISGGSFGCSSVGGCRERLEEPVSCGGRGRSRPLPPLPPPSAAPGGGSKSVRFNIPPGVRLGAPGCSGSETSDQGYESDQSKV